MEVSNIKYKITCNGKKTMAYRCHSGPVKKSDVIGAATAERENGITKNSISCNSKKTMAYQRHSGTVKKSDLIGVASAEQESRSN